VIEQDVRDAQQGAEDVPMEAIGHHNPASTQYTDGGFQFLSRNYVSSLAKQRFHAAQPSRALATLLFKPSHHPQQRCPWRADPVHTLYTIKQSITAFSRYLCISSK